VFAFIFSASEHHDSVFSKTEVGLQMLYNDLPKILSKLLYSYIHPPLAADEVSGLALQLVTANFVMKMMV
jgi:aminopeptidase-like protein